MVESHLVAGRQDLVPGKAADLRPVDHRRLHRLGRQRARARDARRGRAPAPAQGGGVQREVKAADAGLVHEALPGPLQATSLFDNKLPANRGLQPLPAGDQRVLVSVAERALLELFSDIGKQQSLVEARDLVESLSGLREKVLDELLRHTTRIKVVRVAAAFAAEMQLQVWAPRGSKAQRTRRWPANAGSQSAGRARGWTSDTHDTGVHRHGQAAARDRTDRVRLRPLRHEGRHGAEPVRAGHAAPVDRYRRGLCRPCP